MMMSTSMSILAHGKRTLLNGGCDLGPSKRTRTVNGDRSHYLHSPRDKIEPFAAYAQSPLPEQNLEAPLVKSEPNINQPEVITLSDSEDESDNDMRQVRDMTTSDQRLLLVQLKNQLLQEETKLVLLQKLRESLVQPRSNSSLKTQIPEMPKQSRGATPPPLSRKHRSNSPSGLKQTPPPPSMSSSSAQLYQRSKPYPHQPTQSPRMKLKLQTDPPPLINLSNVSPDKRLQQPSTNGHPVNGQESYAPKQEPATICYQTPQLSAETKKSLVKQHCRRDLQQALLNLARQSRNKVLPPEVNFIPSLSSAEFVCLVGLEEVVKRIMTPDQKDVKYVFNPFTCVQCKTDFTPVWKRDQPGSKNVICETCITSNQKKALRLEHTAKLKSEFDQAALKEQEYERRIANGSPLLEIPAVSAATVQNGSTYRAPRSTPQSSNKHAMPQLTSSQPKPTPYTNNRAHSSKAAANMPAKSQSPGASIKVNHSQMLQQQALMQAQQQMNALMAQALVYPQLHQLYGGMTEKQMSDMKKQYLLEMINSGNWPNK